MSGLLPAPLNVNKVTSVAPNRDPPEGNIGVIRSGHPFTYDNLAECPFGYNALPTRQECTQRRCVLGARSVVLKRQTSSRGFPLADYITDGRTHASLHSFATDSMDFVTSSNGHHFLIGKEDVETLLDKHPRRL